MCRPEVSTYHVTSGLTPPLPSVHHWSKKIKDRKFPVTRKKTGEVVMGGKVSSKMAAVGRVVQVRLSNWSIYRTASTLGTQTVRPHAPLIKFPNRNGIPKPNVSEALKTLVASPPQSSPSPPVTAATPPIPRPPGPIARLPGFPDSLATVQELPQRYRRRPLTLEEMNYIQRGGPE
ncbi:28S ribosomal protein S36, mitochondrial isoform X1 [Osmerus eperlanus]|uniref:28S ribosomal protein S36, mitochondrial isoform X1 n=2 Tax=Osmerus eperlanus TaxID=29151 RepID=UPI002E108E90